VCVCACVCVCILSYPAYNAQAPYFHLWPVHLYNSFPHYVIKGTIFEKVTEHEKCVPIFSINLVWNIPYCKKNCVRCAHKCTLVFWCKSYTCKALTKLEYSQKIFEKYQNIKLQKSVQWKLSCSVWTDERINRQDRQTKRPTDRHRDRHDKARKFANAPKMYPDGYSKTVILRHFVPLPQLRGGADKSLARPTSDVVGRNRYCRWKYESVHVPNCKSFLVTEAERQNVMWRARFQQHGDASCHQAFFSAMEGAEGNSRKSDRNIGGTSTIVCHRQKLSGPV